jgi:coenzyme F420-reducing hydrogenase gamma subunit
MTPELRNQIVAGFCRSLVVYVAARFSIGALDQGHLDQIVAALTVIVFAGYGGIAKWRAHKTATEKVDQLNTVVYTKTVETNALRAAMADQKVQTDIVTAALIVNDIPIPVTPPKPDSIEQLAADLHQQKQETKNLLSADLLNQKQNP